MAARPTYQVCGRSRSLTEWTFDWIGVWAICLGVGALAVALFVCFGGRDPGAASFVLIGAAAIDRPDFMRRRAAIRTH